MGLPVIVAMFPSRILLLYNLNVVLKQGGDINFAFSYALPPSNVKKSQHAGVP